jgi:magnesium transporter
MGTLRTIRSRRIFTGKSRKAGLPPGTLLYTGDQQEVPAGVNLITFTSDSYREESVDHDQLGSVIAPFCHLCSDDSASIDQPREELAWLNIDGLHNLDIIRTVGDGLSLHPLLLEDILSTGQRPKLEDYGDYYFVVLRMIRFNDSSEMIESEQVSIVVSPRMVLTFQERPGDVLDPIRERIRHGTGRVRKNSTDYLSYAIIDAIVDNYFTVLEKMGDKIEVLEEELMGNPDDDTLRKIHQLKREMIDLRRSVWPLRELVNGLAKSESKMISDGTRIYLRDVYDHTIQVIDTIESYRDMVSGMMDIYLSSVSNRMNSVMKVLTIIATLFIPLTFFAGIYGMNFHHMPELAWKWAYPLFWVVCLITVTVMLVLFRRKKWL